MKSVLLDGRVAVVTGAGGGLGRAYARELARHGAAVVVNDPGTALDGKGGETSAADAVVGEILSDGGKACSSMSSVATPEGGEAIIETALEHFGRVDIVVNNAGILRDKSFGKLDWDDYAAVQDVHLRGSTYVSQPAYNVMKQQGYGRFIFISSNAGTFGNFGQAAYGSAKAGVIGLSNVLAIEGARHGILSNVVCPLARTRMTESMMDEDSAASPDDVAPLIAYLASETCSISHAVFSAGAGHFARVFTGLTPGWQTEPGLDPTVDDIAANIHFIMEPDNFTIPMSAAEELAQLSDYFKARQAAHRR